jgi:hypothetical protein
VTGESLARRYVVIEGDVNEARETMVKYFGTKWAFQYPSEEAAKIQKWGLERIALPEEVLRPVKTYVIKGTNAQGETEWTETATTDADLVKQVKLVAGIMVAGWDKFTIEVEAEERT